MFRGQPRGEVVYSGMQICQVGFGLGSIKRRADADYDNLREIFGIMRQKFQTFSTSNKGAGKAGFLHCFAYFKTVNQLDVYVKSGDGTPCV